MEDHYQDDIVRLREENKNLHERMNQLQKECIKTHSELHQKTQQCGSVKNIKTLVYFEIFTVFLFEQYLYTFVNKLLFKWFNLKYILDFKYSRFRKSGISTVSAKEFSLFKINGFMQSWIMVIINNLSPRGA